MNALPLVVQKWIEGPIDPHAQHRLETIAHVYLALLALTSFLVSYYTRSVLFALGIFGGGILLLLILAVPPWPFLSSRPIKFLPVRSKSS